MKTIIVASAKEQVQRKIKCLLNAVGVYDFLSVVSFAQIAKIISEKKEGIIICASIKGALLTELDRILPVGWDIIAILPSGVPQPFYSSSLTVLNAPMSKMEFSDTLFSLMSFSVFRQTSYGEEKNEIIIEAKKKIMLEKNTDENSAHRYLQKKSMESGQTVFDTAMEILKATPHDSRLKP